MQLKFYPLLILFITTWGCSNEKTKKESVDTISTLPMKSLVLEDLTAFTTPSSNWTIAGKVLSDYQIEQDLMIEKGHQVLVNYMQESGNENLLTTWEHADMELDLEFMMPKGSNSGVYFQSRYEIQLLDSWKVKSPTFSDCGGIYQRWDPEAPEGEEGYEGHAPAVNASRAPGLWQHLYVKFTAPKFDANGKKISNARFDRVELNGMVIHQDVEVTGPTRASFDNNEVTTAPLMFQGDHGNVAFRNIKYKIYVDQRIELDQLSYQYYEIPSSSEVPDFDSIQSVSQGVADSFNVPAIAEREDLFGIRYEANITIPKSGDYIFHTISDDGSKLYIDQELVVDNNLELGVEKRSGLVSLNSGTHQMRIDYYNNVWSKYLTVYYEGPEIQYQPFYSFIRASGSASLDLLPVEPLDDIELLRGFVNYMDEKRTHVISVGDVEGVHYSFDLSTGALLKAWRGNFADASNMWRNRGSSQLVIPMSPAIEIPESAIMTILNDQGDHYPPGKPPGLTSRGYTLGEDNRPVFEFTWAQATAYDRFFPSSDGERLVRETVYEPAAVEDLYSRLAVAEYIDLLENGLYSIGGQYYIEFASDHAMPTVRESNGKQELVVALTAPITVKYSLLW